MDGSAIIYLPAVWRYALATMTRWGKEIVMMGE
jgi:hypothetical protein